MWTINAQSVGTPAIPAGRVVIVLSVDLDFKSCLVSKDLLTGGQAVLVYIKYLEGCRSYFKTGSEMVGMQFGTKEAAEEYVKRLSNPVRVFTSDFKQENGILVARGDYTVEEANELLNLVSEFNQSYGNDNKLVLHGEFDFWPVKKITGVKFPDKLEVGEEKNERLSLVLDDLE